MTFCPICGRDVSERSEFCRYHQEAFNNLQSTFEIWKKASEMNWEEYLNKLCQIDETGQWVREVAEKIRSEGDPSTMT